MSENNKRAVIYTRVSTKEQGDSGLSLSKQEDQCRMWCEGKGYTIVDVQSDVLTGSNLERPGLQNLLFKAQNHEFDILVSTKLDRISRRLLDFLTLLETFEKESLSIAAVLDPYDDSTPTGRLIRGILLLFAEFERDNGRERTQLAMDKKAEKGEVRGGVPQLGYDKKDKH